jgi:hypothetical protein
MRLLLPAALLSAQCASARATLRPEAPPPAPVGRVVLVGDAGLRIGEIADELNPKAPEGACHALVADVAAASTAVAAARTRVPILAPLTQAVAEGQRSVVVWLGDNVYDRGIAAGLGVDDFWSDDGHLKPGARENPEYPSFAALHVQVSVSRAAEKALFVPGNHDWDSRITQAADGPLRVAAQAAAIRELACRVGLRTSASDIQLVPRDGCAGPHVEDLDFPGVSLRIVAFDSEGVLQAMAGRRRPGCLPEDAFFHELRRQVETAPGLVLLAAHHPLTTYGPHGGYNGSGPLAWAQSALRWVFRSNQDLSGPHNQRMVRKLRAALAPGASRIVAYASGHEHALQVIRRGPDGFWELGTGSASKSSPVRRGRWSQFASSTNGFMYVDLYAGGGAVLSVVEAQEGQAPRVVSARLR